MAVDDLRDVARRWEKILGAEHDHDDRIDAWGARRSRFRVGTGWVDLLEPDGSGPVFDAVQARGSHLFAGGVTTRDPAVLEQRLRASGVKPATENGELLLDPTATGGHGLALVISADEVKTQIGHFQHFYELTNVVHDVDAVAEHYCELLGLADVDDVRIDSETYGYEGRLVLFRPDHLDRIQVARPTDADKLLGRELAAHGESLPVAFGEAHILSEVEAHARRHAGEDSFTSERDEHGSHTVLLHPETLGGMALGLTRSTYAWSWSGRPEKVRNT